MWNEEVIYLLNLSKILDFKIEFLALDVWIQLG